jgi:hypothetical protein
MKTKNPPITYTETHLKLNRPLVCIFKYSRGKKKDKMGAWAREDPMTAVSGPQSVVRAKVACVCVCGVLALLLWLPAFG